MKKLFSLLLLTITSSTYLRAYEHKLRNWTTEKVITKINKKWWNDETVELEPAIETKDGKIIPSEKTVSTGFVCTKGLEFRSEKGKKIKEFCGWCLIPYITQRSRNTEVEIQYKDKAKKSGLKVEIR